MAYIVPLDMPQFCNRCPFGKCAYFKPSWANKGICSIDGKETEPSTYGYVCNIEFEQKHKYESVIRGEIEGNIPKPSWCPLVELRGKDTNVPATKEGEQNDE